MPRYILGLSALYHDSAAALVDGGKILAAAQEERFTRRRHDRSFPHNAIRYCLQSANISPEALSCIAYYERPWIKASRIAWMFLASAPRGATAFSEAVKNIATNRRVSAGMLRRQVGCPRNTPVVFVPHHFSHAASAFFPSPFSNAAILTVDGVGEWTTTARGIGVDRDIRITKEIRFPHSLGLFYAAFTQHLGFRVNSGEFKVMGMAAYGRPVFRDRILDRILRVRGDGSFSLDLRYFSWMYDRRMTTDVFHEEFGYPRLPDEDLCRRHLDIAASVQSALEEALLAIVRDLKAETDCDNLVMAGGVSLNAVANGMILRDGPFKQIWVQPAAGDAGGALGCALAVAHGIFEHKINKCGLDSQSGTLLGPSFDSETIKAILAGMALPYRQYESRQRLSEDVARRLSTGSVVGWFQGRMEYGPRALGARSILADPRRPDMPEIINSKVKFREAFRPFAPSVLADEAATWFSLRPGQESPYMLMVAAVNGATTSVTDSEAGELSLRGTGHSVIPGVTHVDGTARVQTVDRDRSPALYDLLRAFKQQTDVPILINTSFNVRGEPIVCTPQDAIRCFLATDIDLLVLEDIVVDKAHVDSRISGEREQFLRQYLND